MKAENYDFTSATGAGVIFPKTSYLMFLAFMTASACSIYVIENLFLRMLPLPFIRLGMANIVILVLISNGKYWSALLVNIFKSLIGGVFTFTLLSPATLISLFGGLVALVSMYLVIQLKLGFSIIGISIVGAVIHNLVQIAIVRTLILTTNSVFIMIPLLMLLGLISGFIVAIITIMIQNHVSFDNVLGREYDKKSKI